MTPALSCDIRGREDALLVRLHCDSPAAWPALSAPGDLARLVIDSGIDRLVLDLGGVPYLTAASLGGLVALRGRLRASGIDLILRGVGPLAYQALEMTRLTRLFDICERGPDTQPLATSSLAPARTPSVKIASRQELSGREEKAWAVG
jgi:anti-anti-sigma factor